MKPELQKLCDNFIENREEVKKAFKIEHDLVYPVCSNIFLSHGKKADAEVIKECKRYIKDRTSFISNFRGTMFAPMTSLLACYSNPQETLDRVIKHYKVLKQYFFGSSQLVLTSFILSEMTNDEVVRKKVERGKELYKMMKAKHRFLVTGEDSVFAVSMAFSDRSNEDLIEDMEQCFKILKGMANRSFLKTVSQLLSISNKRTEEKCARFKNLFESIRVSGMRYGKNYGLSILASLSVIDVPVGQIVENIFEVKNFLEKQKGYRGLFGLDQRDCLMNAAMLVSTFYSPSTKGDVAAIASMLSIIAVQMTVLIAISNSHINTNSSN